MGWTPLNFKLGGFKSSIYKWNEAPHALKETVLHYSVRVCLASCVASVHKAIEIKLNHHLPLSFGWKYHPNTLWMQSATQSKVENDVEDRPHRAEQSSGAKALTLLPHLLCLGVARARTSYAIWLTFNELELSAMIIQFDRQALNGDKIPRTCKCKYTFRFAYLFRVVEWVASALSWHIEGLASAIDLIIWLRSAISYFRGSTFTTAMRIHGSDTVNKNML